MMTLTLRWRFAAAMLAFATLMTGCSAEGSAAAKKPEAPQAGGPSTVAGTQRNEFLPVLQSSYSKVTWPKAYTMSTDDLWQKLGGGQGGIHLVQSDADGMVAIWNVCAWSLQLIDDTKSKNSTKIDVDRLTALNTGDMQQVIDPILSDSRLGGISAATQFIEANGCKDGFLR